MYSHEMIDTKFLEKGPPSQKQVVGRHNLNQIDGFCENTRTIS